jgi:hypothetical protein
MHDGPLDSFQFFGHSGEPIKECGGPALYGFFAGNLDIGARKALISAQIGLSGLRS